MSTLVITTGGTIGALPYKDFSHTADEDSIVIMPEDGRDLVREALEKKFGFKDRCISYEERDSKFIDELYRFNLLRMIEAAPEAGILITHGTDALLQTADFFYREMKGLAGKIVMLTGSMMPLTNGPESDGYLNLQYSLKQLKRFDLLSGEERNEKAGVYIVLCDYEHPESETGAWAPILYNYQPDLYEKIYVKDGRYNRLRRVKQNAH